MKRFRLFGLVLAVVGCVMSLLAVTASAALPEFLPNAANTWTGTSIGKATLNASGGTQVVCEGPNTATGTLEAAKPLGLFHILFTKCKSLGQPCLGLGDTTAETILSLGLWHLVFDSLSPLGVAIFFLVEPTHFTCAGILVVTKGGVLCLVLNPGGPEPFEFHCTVSATSSFSPSEVTYWNAAGAEVKMKGEELLLTSISTGTPVESAELALGTVKFANPVTIMF